MRTLTHDQIAKVMAAQQRIWDGTPNAKEIIEDCCHALANELHLGVKNYSRQAFMAKCNEYRQSE